MSRFCAVALCFARRYMHEHGSDSPLSDDERRTIARVRGQIREHEGPRADEVLAIIDEHVARLEAFGALASRYPSPLAQQSLGGRQRNVHTLMEHLSSCDAASFEFRAPTRAIIGRALDMAELNFYRLLWNVCEKQTVGDSSESLREEIATCFRLTVYTKLVEEVLADITTDRNQDPEVRRSAVYSLAQIWDGRLTYRLSEFFPVLQATWDARQRIRVVGGTLRGTQEVMALFREGCDPAFVDYFTREDPDPDEVEAFREFLFGKTSEELGRLAEHLEDSGASAVDLSDAQRWNRDAGVDFYYFFRQRALAAGARSLAQLPGPKRTAEGYVMIAHLRRRG